MTALYPSIEGTPYVDDAVYDESLTVRIANDAAENGYDQEPGGLTWLNSARITADPDEDAVHCVVSVGDPRGGFCFTVRRTSDGKLVIHTPHPGESFAHCETKVSHEGTLEVVGDFSDPEPEWVGEVSKLSRERCTELCEGPLGMAVYDDEPIEDLREAIADGVRAGDIHPEDL